MACMGCIKAAEFESNVTFVTQQPSPIAQVVEDLDWTPVEILASNESEVERVRAAIAAHNGVSPDSVDVVTTQRGPDIELAYVLVFIGSQAAVSLTKKLRDR